MKRIIASLFLTIALSISMIAQSDGSSISGTVNDAAGEVMQGATVRLVNAQQTVIGVFESDIQGRFRFENIEDGSYVIVVSRANFSTRSESVKLSGTDATDITLVLQINQIKASVTVTADTGVAEELQKVPVQVNVVSLDSIRQRTTNVLAQVADEETGVSMQRTSPTIGAVLVRGLTEVGVYVDGVRYTNATQRGGINTFFNLNEPTALGSVEIQRSPNTAQFGSDGLGGNVQLLSRQPEFEVDTNMFNGEFNSYFVSADSAFGGNTLLGYGTRRFGILGNVSGRRINTLRPGGGVDSHSAINRFFSLPSNIVGSDRLPDTGFTQYSGNFHLNYSPAENQNLSIRYQRSQQDGGKRYDQMLGGDGNLIAGLKNLMLDFGYIRYTRVGFGFFDNFSAKLSYNSQREQRVNQGGQGNPLGAITNDKERTSSWGGSFFLDRSFSRHTFLIGGDHYHDRVSAASFGIDPVSAVYQIVRPRVPNGSTYDLTGLYVQDVFEAIPDRLRLSGALRYNFARYSSRSSASPLVNGQPLFPDDAAKFNDFSGRIGATITLVKGLNAAFNYSRGFRAPNITSLGGLGLVGVGYQVSAGDVAGLGATIGSTADANAVTTGQAVEPLRSEISDNFDVSLRFRNRRFDASVTWFRIDYGDTIVRQTLILPLGAAGLQLGSQTITDQNANGAIFVPASTSPVLIQANFSDARMTGAEFNFDYILHDRWTIAGHYSYVFAEDKATGLPPNLGGGGFPPQFGFLRLRYQPSTRYWVEGFINLAGRQTRLSSLDMADCRTGGSRTRSQIQNFFRRGACVRGITTPGPNGQCGVAGGTLIATGETLAQVQNRVLPIGSVINGILVVNADTAVPLFKAIPGYGLIGLRGGYKIGEHHTIMAALENIGDKSHRAPGWGIDGPGRSLTLRYQYRF